MVFSLGSRGVLAFEVPWWGVFQAFRRFRVAAAVLETRELLGFRVEGRRA